MSTPNPVPTPTPTTTASSGLLANVGNLISQQFTKLTEIELVNVLPPVITFLNWVSANPSASTNPLTVVPQINQLGAALLVAQVSADAEMVKSISDLMSTALQAQLTALKAKLG